MERDEETGLEYHTARYYAPWLGRWTAADPIGLGDCVNRYAYSRDNPIHLSDPAGTDPPQDQPTRAEIRRAGEHHRRRNGREGRRSRCAGPLPASGVDDGRMTSPTTV